MSKPEPLEELNEILNIQKSHGNWNYNPYMMGLCNGLILARSTVNEDDQRPEFMHTPERWLEDAANSFQSRVEPWLLECFGPMIAGDKEERNNRFLEEALELVQACGSTAEEAHKLVDYVFGRKVGEKRQEVGGVRVTLSALCLAQNIDEDNAAEAELDRIRQPEMVEAIREKQKTKPSMSPLPGVYPERVVFDTSEVPE